MKDGNTTKALLSPIRRKESADLYSQTVNFIKESLKMIESMEEASSRSSMEKLLTEYGKIIALSRSYDESFYFHISLLKY